MQKDVQCDGYVKRAVHVVKKDKLQIEVDVFNIHNQPTPWKASFKKRQVSQIYVLRKQHMIKLSYVLKLGITTNLVWHKRIAKRRSEGFTTSTREMNDLFKFLL